MELTGNTMPKLSLAMVLPAVTAYSVLVGMAYLWGYWHSFGINIMDYLGVSDILMASAWPLLSLCCSLLFGMFIGGNGSINPSKNDKNFLGGALIWYWTHLRDVHFFLIFLIWVLDVPNKWFLIALLGGVPVAVYVNLQFWMESLPIPRRLRIGLVMFLVMLPPGAISLGQSSAENIQLGRFCQVVYSDVVGIPLPVETKIEARLRLIGQRGDTLFMWLPQERRAVITKFSSDHPLIIGRIDAATRTTGWQWISDGFARLMTSG